ncbi:flagellar assembly protein FliW [Bacillus sp. FJAT-49736]|uniref:flagellar assembly protein FliW n=1 Tax=Bacillus sp. FJAT-49736 TaxID=2833582 RepID=UPI001BC8D87D|nr:flagellar assembly protein FliW [Bacillus sp. FJAT-49736]MBS4174161.1 flagellar assembly protein FliW [Bacillus sp. FJAT-49736]
MKIRTKYHGEIEIKNEEIWLFNNGIPGFPAEKEFILLPLPDNDVFTILQSVKTAEIAFVITDPFSFFQNYEFSIDDQTLEQLKLQNEEDVQVSVILTVQDPFEKTTANLQAPVIFNVNNKEAKQMILNDKQYTTKQSLFGPSGVK